MVVRVEAHVGGRRDVCGASARRAPIGANLDLRTLTDIYVIGYHPFTLFSLYRLNGVRARGVLHRFLLR